MGCIVEDAIAEMGVELSPGVEGHLTKVLVAIAKFKKANGIEQAPKRKSDKVKTSKKRVNIGGTTIEFMNVPEGSIANLASNRSDGIRLQEGITADKVLAYLDQEAADPKLKDVLDVKTKANELLKDKHGIDFKDTIKAMNDTTVREFLLLHEHRHNLQAEKRTNRAEFIKEYLADPVKFEYDANEYALKKLGYIVEKRSNETGGPFEFVTKKNWEDYYGVPLKFNANGGAEVIGTNKVFNKNMFDIKELAFNDLVTSFYNGLATTGKSDVGFTDNVVSTLTNKYGFSVNQVNSLKDARDSISGNVGSSKPGVLATLKQLAKEASSFKRSGDYPALDSVLRRTDVIRLFNKLNNKTYGVSTKTKTEDDIIDATNKSINETDVDMSKCKKG